MKVIFMGTPAFALPTLEKLINSPIHQVQAVFTQKPKPKGRRLSEEKSPVHEQALLHGIPVHNPKTLRSEEAVSLIDSIDADIIVVVAYGFIVPKMILKAKKYGCLNIHPSKLPRHRGAAPLQRTIIEGDTETAVCVMKMDEGLDTGNIILQKEFNLSPRITLKQLHDKCAVIGTELLIETLAEIDNLPETVQSDIGVTYAAKLSKEEGGVDWREDAYKIDCKIRGMTPWPGVYFKYQNKIIKILEADYNSLNHELLPGTVINSKLEVACRVGTLMIKKLQQEGKRALNVEEFLRGMPILPGTIL